MKNNEEPLFNINNNFEKRYLDVYKKYFAEPVLIANNYNGDTELYRKFEHNLYNDLLNAMKLSNNDSIFLLNKIFPNHLYPFDVQHVYDIIEDVIKHENFVLELELYKHIKGEWLTWTMKMNLGYR